MKFTDLPVDERILKALAELGFEECTPVQDETFRLIFAGRDVEAQSQTGTGKTAAFLISGFHLLLTDEKMRGKRMLVVCPTRELADQIEKDAKLIGKYLGFRIGSFYGGVGFAQQEKMLEEGVDVMIGTPGRLLDYASSRKVNFKDVGVLVIDEADRMFDMGFLPDIRRILKGMNPPAERRTFLFSATMNAQVGYLAWEYMTNPGEIVVEPEQVSVKAITQEIYHVAHEEKLPLLLGILKNLNPQSAVFFVNTKHAAVKLARRLEINGFPAEFLIGDLPQTKRLQVIRRTKEKKINWLVATDVAARGLHIEDLDLVVNYDIPLEAETYVHRIGRTARAGKSGRAVSLACEKYVYGLKAIEEFIGLKIPVQWARDSDVVIDKSAGMFISGDIDGAPQRPRRNRTQQSRPQRHTDRKGDSRYVARNLVAEAASGKMPGRGPALRGGDARPHHPPKQRPHGTPSATASLEDRLAFYKKKYGNEFQKATEGPGKKTEPVKPSERIEATSPEPSKRKRRRRTRKGRGVAQQLPVVNTTPVAVKQGFFQKIFAFLFGKKEKAQ